MAMKDYVPVRVRLAKARNDFKEKNFVVTTEANVNYDKECCFFKATLSVNDKVVAMGHAFAELGEDKAFEKAETVSIGRALDNLGYEADDADFGETETEKPALKSSGLGLGKKTAKKEESKDDTAEDAPKAPAKQTPPPAKKAAAPPVKQVEAEVVEEETASEEEGVEETEAPPAKTAAPAAPAKLGNIMAKYGLGAKK